MAVKVCDLGSDSSANYFKKIYNSFQPATKFICFQDNENFLFSDYQLQNQYINAIIENDKGDQIQFESLNCGYGGEGPSATAQVLEKIGIDKELAAEWMHYPGLSISFPYKDGNHVRANVLFVHSTDELNSQKFKLNQCSLVNVVSRKIYTINPQIYNFQGLLNLLDVMQPTEMEFNIGAHSNMLNSQKISDVFRHDINDGSNI